MMPTSPAGYASMEAKRKREAEAVAAVVHFSWYDGSGPLTDALKKAGLPEYVGEWNVLDKEEIAGKHDCTDWAGFYEDPDELGTGYYAQGSTSYNNGLQSLYIDDTRKHRRVMMPVTKEEPVYQLI